MADVFAWPRPHKVDDSSAHHSINPTMAGGREGPLVKFAILGQLEAYEGSQPLQLGPFKQRVVLGLLLCQANRIVSVSALSEALWDDSPPRTAHKNLQVYVSSLRRILALDSDASESEGAKLVHCPPGYSIQVEPEQLDALRFHDLARAGRRAALRGHAAAAVDLLGQAIRLWRGPVLPDMMSARNIAVEAKQLREQYLTVYEDWAEARLALGHHVDLVDGINELAWHNPFRERLRHAQMLALYRSGRQTEALAQFDAMRQLLAQELGLQPSPVLTRLYESILRGDHSLEVPNQSQLAPVSVRAVSAERTSLARDVADFTGRAGPVKALLEILDNSNAGRVAMINGPVGVGKTALALHCAHRLGERFPDGRVVVSLRGADGRPRVLPEVLGDLLHGMSATEELPDNPQERAALLRESTAGRKTLFILDDAVTESQVRSVLLAVGDSRVVATSRRHLGGLESAAHITVVPMSEVESIDLLSRLIDPERVAAQLDAAKRVTAICHGLPLLLRIVGAKLVGLPHLSLSRLAERLGNEGRLLDELVAGDLEIRSRLTVAYQDLSPDDQVTLNCFASLPDSPHLAPEVGTLLGTDGERAEAAIERLIEAHLVDAYSVGGEVRYSMPSLIRAFVRELDSSRVTTSK